MFDTSILIAGLGTIAASLGAAAAFLINRQDILTDASQLYIFVVQRKQDGFTEAEVDEIIAEIERVGQKHANNHKGWAFFDAAVSLRQNAKDGLTLGEVLAVARQLLSELGLTGTIIPVPSSSELQLQREYNPVPSSKDIENA